MDTITWIGIGASACTAISMLPQVIKIMQEKKAGNVSVAMQLVLFAGLGLWIWYGTLKPDWVIIISNSLSLIINTVLLVLTLKYRHKS